MQAHQRSWTPSEGWSAALPDAQEGSHTLILAFVDPLIDAGAATAELASTYPGATIAGCSSAGEIHGDEVREMSASVSWIQFDTTRVVGHRHSIVDDNGNDSDRGHAIADALDPEGLRAVLILSDGLSVNGTALAMALGERLGKGVVVSGGLAGDGARFGQTWTSLGVERDGASIVAIGLYGDDLVVGTASQGGWDPFGPVRRVTKSDNNVLYELDGTPALTLYKKYLGDRASGLPATALLFPLAIRDPERKEPLVRTILSVDEEAQSMTFAGDLPEGAEVQLMRAHFERLVDGAATAGELATASMDNDRPTYALAVSCVGRKLVLGAGVDEEVEATLEACPPGTVMGGFYSYGELSPRSDGTCELHNQTMTLTLLQERAH